MLASVCGDTVVWKPSEKTPLTAIACQSIANRAAEEMPDAAAGLVNLIVGRADAGRAVAAAEGCP